MKKITLKASNNNKFVTNELNQSNHLIADRETASDWEFFELNNVTGDYFFNVRDFGATGNGSDDDRAAIQQAIDAAANVKGGTVFFPAGTYLIQASLQVNGLVTLLGSGWGTNSAQLDRGSFIYFQSDFTGNAINVNSRSVTIERLGFRCDQPGNSENWSPNSFGGGYAIHVKEDDVTLKDIFLFNVTKGINLSNRDHSIGRIRLENIFGQPLEIGINVDNALDVIRIDNVHFWPFWSSEAHVSNFQLRNARGLASFKNDNPFYSNIFCLQYRFGMYFGKSVNPGGSEPVIWGKTSKFKIVNGDFDFCTTGIKIDGDGTTGAMSNISCQGPNAGDPNEEGILVASSNVSIQVCNVHVYNYNNNGIRVGGAGSVALLENVWVDKWDVSGNGFPAIEAVETESKILLGAGRLFSGNAEGTQYGGHGTIQVSSMENAF